MPDRYLDDLDFGIPKIRSRRIIAERKRAKGIKPGSCQHCEMRLHGLTEHDEGICGGCKPIPTVRPDLKAL